MEKASSALLPVIAIDRKALLPLHKQIYDTFREHITHGSLRAGQQMPSTRALALELKLSRIPVLTAYSQLLAEGYCETRAGAGTFVSRVLPQQEPVRGRLTNRNKPAASKPRSVAHRAQWLAPYKPQPWLGGLGAFCLGQPAYDEFPFHLWAKLVARHCRHPHINTLHYTGPFGSEALRRAICTYLRTSRAVRCDPHQIMIVSGSQQALELTARVLLDAGDSAWVEEPGYWLTKEVLTALGCKLVPVPVDREGLDVAQGIRRCGKARAAYITPSHQFPLGVTMSAARRLQLLDWAERAGSWIVEDDYDSEYRYDSMPIASLQGLDRNDRVIYIGTFSKTLFPGLRLGYLVIPEDLIERFAAVRNAMDLGSPYLYQTVLADFIVQGHFARHIRRMRQLYNERRLALVESLRKHFGRTLDILGAEAGMHLAVTLPMRIRDTEVSLHAAREKLWVAPLSSSYTEQPGKRGFILGFGGTPAAQAPEAVAQLNRLLRNS
ncbi:MAG: PLP-dependent aminotransferase family protein [Candidatus Korobacteraceae bacterium]